MVTMSVSRGLIPQRTVPNALIPKHCAKLVMPNTSPRTALPVGPRATAPMATGIILKVILSGPMLR